MCAKEVGRKSTPSLTEHKKHTQLIDSILIPFMNHLSDSFWRRAPEIFVKLIRLPKNELIINVIRLKMAKIKLNS